MPDIHDPEEFESKMNAHFAGGDKRDEDETFTPGQLAAASHMEKAIRQLKDIDDRKSKEMRAEVEKSEEQILTPPWMKDAVSSSPAPKSIADFDQIQDYRFGQMFKGEHFAFARGLTINPTHLPQALDAMLNDGWQLVSLFGQTDAQSIGFIFERVKVQTDREDIISQLVTALATTQAKLIETQGHDRITPPALSQALTLALADRDKAVHRSEELLRANTALVLDNRALRVKFAEAERW